MSIRKTKKLQGFFLIENSPPPLIFSLSSSILGVTVFPKLCNTMLWHFSSARDYYTVPKQCETLFWMWCTKLCCTVRNAQSRGGLLFSILTVSGECNAGWLQCKKCSKSGDNPQLCKSEHCGAAVLKKWRQVCTQCKSEQKMQKVKK